MKNLQKLALGLIVGFMAIGFSAFTISNNISDGKFANVYRLKTTFSPQAWNSPVNQDINRYELAPITYSCNPSSPDICTYSIDEDTEQVTQLGKGTFL